MYSQELNIVTIVAKNYLAQARVLVNSFKACHPNGKAFVLFVDAIDDYFDPAEEKFISIELNKLRDQISHLEGFCFQYSILELCTAVKPYLLKYLFQKLNLAKLIYFDPDILITGDLQPLSELLDHYDIVLTPHITKPYEDNKSPTVVNILQSGTYNLGFIAISNTQTTLAMLTWWESSLYKQCVTDIANGLFVDQKWMDLVPVFFQKTYILREPGYNVAYWNLHERTISIGEDKKITCNTQLLRFFHYSGYDPDQPDQVSKHQNRYTFSMIGEAEKLFSLYSNLLLSQGYHECKKWPYSYATFENQVVIPSLIRRIYLNLAQREEKFPNPFKTNSPNSFFKWLTYFSTTQLPPLLLEIYRLRLDLRIHFPDIKGKNKSEFLNWCLENGIVQYGLDKKLLYDIIRYLKNPEGFERIGVNLAGYFNSEKGMGTAVRADIHCLKETEFPFVLNDVIDAYSLNQEELNAQKLSKHRPYNINLIHVNADQTLLFFKQKSEDFFKNRYNIGRWEWEFSHFPEEWCESFEPLDEIWVASSFIQEAIAHISPIPVVKIPHAIEIKEIKKPRYDRQFFDIPSKAFVFLFIFDFESYAARKNPYGTINAFKKAFSSMDDVVLVIKSSHSERHPAELKNLLKLSENLNVILIDKVMSSEEVACLMYHADCYVSLHRCEGFGLTIAEAMGLGKPVIATAYSGNTDFMSPGNCYPVDYRLVELDKDYGPYKKGWVWAEPNLDQAANFMRYVYEYPKEAAETGRMAREYIIKYFSPSAVGKIYQKRLEQIFKKIQINSAPPSSASDIQNYEKNFQISDLEEKANYIDIHHLCVQSNKPFIGSLIKLYKRFVRKSSFWLLNPLISSMREFSTALIHLEKKSIHLQNALLNRVHQLEEKSASTQDNLIKINQKTDEMQTVVNELKITSADSQEYVDSLNMLLHPLIYANKGVTLPITEKLDYFSFESIFRGSEDLLKERMKQYVELFLDKEMVLDVGCGRGEFLELLRGAGINAIGVDNNPEMIRMCRQKGLNVVESDFMEYLATCPQGKFDGIFSSQFIEHIMPEQIHTFFRTAYLKLKSGGIVVSETVNPYNLAQFRFFWVDPTHKQPIYPEVAVFLSQTAGFKDTSINFIPSFGEGRPQLQEPWDYGDYAVIAKKVAVQSLQISEEIVNVCEEQAQPSFV